MLTNQVEYRSVYAECTNAGGYEQNSDSLAAERGKVEEWWPVVVPILVLDFPLLVF